MISIKYTLEKPEGEIKIGEIKIGEIKIGESRDTGNIGHARHKTKTNTQNHKQNNTDNYKVDQHGHD